jgi:taurine dioxygenase
MPVRELQVLSVKPISGALGAMIDGVDLGRELEDNQVISDIHQALLDYQVIFFRDQHLTPEQHLSFGRKFGTLNVHDYVRAMDGHPEIIVVAKDPADTKNFGGGWHSDVTYLEKPALGSILYCLEAPAYGGDTMFANQYMAYDRLSSGMKRMLDGMTAIHTARDVYGRRGYATVDYTKSLKAMQIVGSAEAEQEVEHPVVRTHPETGRKCLYINQGFTKRFKDMTEEESLPLLEYLWKQCTRPELTCRFRWRPGSIAFWDNRAVQHYALNDYNGQRRCMHRVTINGDRPV